MCNWSIINQHRAYICFATNKRKEYIELSSKFPVVNKATYSKMLIKAENNDFIQSCAITELYVRLWSTSQTCSLELQSQIQFFLDKYTTFIQYIASRQIATSVSSVMVLLDRCFVERCADVYCKDVYELAT